MPSISKELINAMKYYLPASRAKLEIRMERPDLDLRASGVLAEQRNQVDKIIAALPRTIVHSHALANQSCAELCDLVHERPMGFQFPGWRAMKFAKELDAQWLGEDAKRLNLYCLDNDLRPGFGRLLFYGRYHAKATYFMIRWQREHLDKLLDIRSHPLFDQYGRYRYNDTLNDQPLGSEAQGGNVDVTDLTTRATMVMEAKKAAGKARWDQYQKEFNEESDEVAKAYIPTCMQKVREAADRGRDEALIFHARGGDLITNWIWSWEEDMKKVTLTDIQMFHKPTWDGAVARGLCRWAAANGWKYRIDAPYAYAAARDSADIYVSLKPKSAG